MKSLFPFFTVFKECTDLSEIVWINIRYGGLLQGCDSTHKGVRFAVGLMSGGTALIGHHCIYTQKVRKLYTLGRQS